MRLLTLALTTMVAGSCGTEAGETVAAQDAAGHAGLTASATIRDGEGTTIGEAYLIEGEQGVVITAQLEGAPAGTHAMHIHATGACEPPFSSAGGHARGATQLHGILASGGMHTGDLPNVHVPDDGALRVDAFAVGATLGAADTGRVALLDADGSAIVLHAGPDDYATDPAGEAGDRIACGVITP